MSESSPAAAALLADRAWRWRHSTWMLTGLLTCGLLACLGYLYIAIRTRKRVWWALAGVSSLVTVGLFVTSPPSSESGASSAEQPTSPIYGFLIALALALVVAGFFLNRSWLRWLAEYQGARRASAPPPAAALPPPAMQPPSPPPTAVAAPPQPPTVPAPQQPPAPPAGYQAVAAPLPPNQLAPEGTRRRRIVTRRSEPDRPRSGEPVIPLELTPTRPATVGVNRATVADLSLVLGLELGRCQAIEDERRVNGPFISVEDFIARARLTALEASRLRDRIIV